MITFKGYPEDGALYTGYNVLRDVQKVGFIEVGGFFRKDSGVTLTEDEQNFIRAGCKKIFEQPSEFGCFGVGESPMEPFDEDRCGDVSRKLAAR